MLDFSTNFRRFPRGPFSFVGTVRVFPGDCLWRLFFGAVDSGGLRRFEPTLESVIHDGRSGMDANGKCTGKRGGILAGTQLSIATGVREIMSDTSFLLLKKCLTMPMFELTNKTTLENS